MGNVGKTPLQIDAFRKGGVTLCNFSCNLSLNFVATQVAREIT